MSGISRTSLEVVPVRSGKWRGFMARDYADSDLMKLFADEDFPSKDFPGNTEFIKNKKERAYLYRVTLPAPGGERTFYAKIFFYRPWTKSVKGVFIPKEAHLSWKAARIMTEEGILTPRPVALLEQKTLGFQRMSVFINEGIPHGQSESLEHYFRENFDLETLPAGLIREKREIIRLIGDMFARTHKQKRIYFPDFHPHNMVFQKKPSGEIKLFLVDFDEVRFHVRSNDRMKNLASLCRNADKIVKKMTHLSITPRDRFRFVRAYLGEHATLPEARALYEDIQRNREMR